MLYYYYEDTHACTGTQKYTLLIILVFSLTYYFSGLYFSAHWCPPCRSFTPQLAKFYTDFKKEHPSDFEIVFISCDNDEDSFKSYFKEMPWLSLPFDSPFKVSYCILYCLVL